MKKKLECLFVNDNDEIGPVIMDKTATETLDVEAELQKLMNLKPGDFAIVRVIIDDFNDKEEPFTVDLADKVIAKEVEGVFCIKNEVPVTILHTKVNDKYPILGLTSDGRPCQWDAEGNCADGDPDKKLAIFVHLDEKDPSIFNNPEGVSEDDEYEDD